MAVGSVFIGARIRQAREARQMSRRDLAALVDLSEEAIRSIESGRRAVTRQTLPQFVKALRLDPNQLTDQPYRWGFTAQDQVFETLPELRLEMASFGVEPADGQPLPLDELRQLATATSLARHRGELAELGTLMPGVLRALRVASFAYANGAREQVMGLYAEALFGLRQLLHKIGYRDLATGTVGPYLAAAAASDDPLWISLGRVFQAGDLDLSGDAASAGRVLDRELNTMQEPSRPPELAMRAFLHFQAAFAHARRDEVTAWSHYEAAGGLIRRLPGPEDTHRLAISYNGWRIWGPAVAMSMGDGAKAVALSDLVEYSPGTVMERYAQVLIDRAQGQLMVSDWDGASATVEKIIRLAPQLARHSVDVHEVVLVLLQRQRSVSGSIQQLADSVGVLARG